MTVRAERELKFVVGRDTLRTALTIPLPGEKTHGPVSQALKSTYFDTETLELMRRGVSWRVRESGGDCVLASKRALMLMAGISSAMRRRHRSHLQKSISTSSTVESPPS